MSRSKSEFIQTHEAVEISGLSDKTLRKYADEGKIHSYRTEGGQRRFKRADIERLRYNGGINTITPETKGIWKVAYARVSSKKQEDDLERQSSYLREKYPDYELVTDIGSGINFQRKGLRRILEKALQGTAVNMAIAHKDRLCRFGYELIQFIIEETGGYIFCPDSILEKSKEEELAEDLLSIIQVFNCKQMGRRRYQNTRNKTPIHKDGGTEIPVPEDKNTTD